MRQLAEISKARDTAAVVLELTSAFEGIASMRIAQIKDQALQSQQFFGELWRIYSQIRVDKFFHYGRGGEPPKNIINKTLLILITSEGGFSGDVDQRLVEASLRKFDPQKYDIIVVGHHGVVQLSQRNVPITRSFKLPHSDRNINVLPLVVEAQKYAATVVYYPTYISLVDQEVKTIRLIDAVAERGQSVKKGEEVIVEGDYIFEPNAHAVVGHLERSMMQITLSEVILEAKLAQYASRFRAMSSSHSRADDSLEDLTRQYNRSRRQLKDERLKEIINGLRKYV